MSLPPVEAEAKPHDIWLSALIRRGLGLWKRLGGLDTTPWQADPEKSTSWNRGAYLVNGPGHCGECHTPRNSLMMERADREFAGGPHPDGSGRVPSLRGLIVRGKYKDAKDLQSAMQFGEMMGYDRLSSGGMADVQAGLAKLPENDIAAIAEYLVSLK
jgi:mono/diheme cytochrome c family protein